MKRILFALLLALVFVTSVSAQEATPEAPLTIVEAGEVVTVYVEVLPAWVLPGYAVLLTIIGFLMFAVYKYGIHLKDMISEKAFAALLGIVRDFAKDIAERTENKIDDALVGMIPDEPTGSASSITPAITPMPDMQGQVG